MKKYTNYLILGCFIMLGSGCHENELPIFAESQAVNFMTWDRNKGYVDDPASLNGKADFSMILENTIIIKTIYAKLQGSIPEDSLAIFLKVTPIDTFPVPEVIFLKNYYIRPGGHMDTLVLAVKRPSLSFKDYKADIRFDAERSDVRLGTAERQTFQLTVFDSFNFSWSQMGTSEKTWNTYIKPYIGNWSVAKIKFILITRKEKDLREFRDYMQNSYLRPIAVNALKKALEKYNSENGPYMDENGLTVSFEP